MIARLIGLIVVAAWLAGCTTSSSETGGGVMGQELPPKPREARKKYGDVEQTYTKPAPAPVMKERKVDEVVSAPPAVDSLLKKATSQRATGNDRAAAATIERAIRLAPRYPASYYMLADIRLDQGSTSQARSLASKALALGAEGDLKAQAEALIEQCDSAAP